MAATESDFTGLNDTGAGVYFGDSDGEWIPTVRALKSLTAFFVGKNPGSTSTGTEPTDILAYLGFGLDGQATNHLDWRIGGDSGGEFDIDENTGSDATPVWATRATIAAAGAVTLAVSLTLATGATVTGILDEDAMGSDSATQLATQQSIKAYVDANVGLDITGLTGESAIVAADQIPFYDADAAANRKITWTELLAALEAVGGLDHDSLQGFVANEHIDWTSTASNLSTSGTAGVGALTVTSIVGATGATLTGFLDEDAMGSDSATHGVTQQSVKAYVDSGAADVVRYATAGEFSKAQGMTEVTTGSSGGTYTMDFDASNYFELTLTENVTTVTINNKTKPGTRILKIIQDSTTRTVDFGAGVLWPTDGTPPTISTAPGAVDIISFLVDSSGTVYGSFAQTFS